MENISTLENSSSILSVTLHENNFTKDGTYYATVSRNTATFKNILSEIAEDNKGMDPYMLQFAAILIQKKILKMLEQGKAVNVLDLGTMYSTSLIVLPLSLGISRIVAEAPEEADASVE